jgi:hypothetical protein
MQYMHNNLRMHTICGEKMQYPHYDPNLNYIWGKENAIHAQQFKNAHYMWGKNAIPTL